ncbi:MAG: putative small protein [Fibrobacteres bacterium]|nr:putative small protein [Fibrobacterota bacterium]
MEDGIPNNNQGDYRPVHETGRNEIQFILNALRGLRYGSVEIIVQDSRVVQIQRLEKQRLV